MGRLSLTIILYKTTLVNKKLERKSPLPFCCLMSKPRYSFVVFSTGRGYSYHIANKAAGGILNCFSCMTTFRRRVSHLLFIMSFFSTAFSPEQLLNAVQLATQFAIWMGFLSLLVEILGALTR